MRLDLVPSRLFTRHWMNLWPAGKHMLGGMLTKKGASLNAVIPGDGVRTSARAIGFAEAASNPPPFRFNRCLPNGNQNQLLIDVAHQPLGIPVAPAPDNKRRFAELTFLVCPNFQQRAKLTKPTQTSF